MSELSKQYHSIIIGDINTWDNWHLVPTSRPVINPPEVNTQYVEIPGADGALDYTEALTGAPVYKNRTGSWEFIVMNGYQEWHELYETILSYLHGKSFTITLEDDPKHQYTGRLTINAWKSEEHNSKITIDYNLSPYKKIAAGYTDDWKWDDLTFNSNAYTIYYGSFDVVGSRDRVIYNPTDDRIELAITTTSKIKVYQYGQEYGLYAGVNEHSQIYILPGGNLLTFVGGARVTINYDKGVANI